MNLLIAPPVVWRAMHDLLSCRTFSNEKEEENIDVLELDAARAMEMMQRGEINDAKTIMLLQYAKLNNLL